MKPASSHAWRLLLSSALGLLLALAAAAAVGVPSVRAAGTFYVNSTLDNNLKDTVLTLREAILVANGTLASGLSDGERSLLGGCTFGGSANNWFISGGCGTGITDSVYFAFTTTVITLSTPLPALNDSRPTFLLAPFTLNAEVAVDGSNLGSGSDVLRILSSFNLVDGLTFRNGPAAGLYVSGYRNRVTNVRAYGNAGPGIVVTGSSGTEIFGAKLGFRDLDEPYACNAATRNGGPNVLLTGGTFAARVDSITSVCAPGDGVLITGTSTMSNSVQYGYHGTWYEAGGLRLLGNGGAGIAVRAGSDANRIEDNIVGFNEHGIVIAGPGSNRNVVRSNDVGQYLLAVIPNTKHGILINGSAADTIVQVNNVSGNTQSGIVISSTTNNSTNMSGNDVKYNGANGIVLMAGTSGNSLAHNLVHHNSGAGILLTGTAALNGIYDAEIHDNGGAGIAEMGSAGLNVWSRLSMNDNGGLGIDRKGDGIPTMPYPVIKSYVQASVGISVTGVATPGWTVELYRVAPDPSRYGEGRTYIGSAAADGSGNWRIADPAGSGCYTAHMHGVIALFPVATEFGPNSPCLYLPAIMR